MLQTSLTRLLGIDHPVIQGSFGPWPAVELAAAVSEAGGLGSVGTATKDAAAVEREIAAVRERTDRPFAVNHTLRPFNEDAYAATLGAAPPVISLALGVSRELRAHDAGSLFVQQVHSVSHAELAAETGVDAIIAQGGEAGGFGAYVGTRFLASVEAGVSDDWKRRVVESSSGDAVKVEFADEVFPPPSPGAFAVTPRALRTAFIEEGVVDAERKRSELMAALAAGHVHELVPFTGQSAGGVHEVLPAAEIVRSLVEGAEAALREAP